MKKRNALLSVYHKEGIVEFAKNLIRLGFSILASGGTAEHLKNAGVEVTDVATLVGGGPILDHRVVTLSRQVHAGLLAKKDAKADVLELEKMGVPLIDLVCVDLYPLREEIAREGSTPESVTKKTDIGGPTMIRSAIKGERIVICDPEDRMRVIKWLDEGEPENGLVKELRAKGEFVISKYCMASANYLSDGKLIGIFGKQTAECKYGENAWQTPAGLFSSGANDPLALDKFSVIGGTTPSYNNFADIDRLLQVMTHIAAALDKNFDAVPLIAIGGKHGNPCGAAVGFKHKEVISNMLKGDPLAIFGGLVMVNFAITPELAEFFAGKQLDGLIAPEISPEAIEMLKRKKDKCRFIVNPALSSLSDKSLDKAMRFRYVRGGVLRQPNYTYVPSLALSVMDQNMKVFSASPLSMEVERDALLAWAIGSTSNSNTITLVKGGMLIGNGVGQQDRVGAASLAITRATRSKFDLEGSTAYSDSFFPFPDGPEVLINAGVKTIFTTSGSIRDQLTIDLCKNRGVNLIMIPDAIGRGFFGH